MRRILIKVAYDGTDFHGWQLQPGVRTVESELNAAIKALTGEEIAVTGASRTDAGVHSMGNVAVFDTESTIPADRFCPALNTYLPEDVKVTESFEVKPDFHPRKVNCRKTYEYRILCSRVPDPLRRRNTWQIPYALDVGKMQEAAKYLIGEHDFASFCCVRTQAESTVRTVFDIEVTGKDNTAASKEITIRVTGNGFLYNMVRIIAGTLVEVGAGKKEPEWVKEALEKADRTEGGPTAPPQGLVLKEIIYEEK